MESTNHGTSRGRRKGRRLDPFDMMHKVRVDSVDAKELMTDIQHTCISEEDIEHLWQIQNVWIIHNPELHQRYEQRRIQMRNSGRTERETEDRLLFVAEGWTDVQKVCKFGVRCREKKRDVLGDTHYGIHLNRNYDVLMRFMAFKNFQKAKYLVVMKAMLGRAKPVTVQISGEDRCLAPTPNFDCHVSDRKPQVNNMRIGDALAHNFAYIYEYDEDAIAPNQFPSQLLPIAVIQLTRSENRLIRPQLYRPMFIGQNDNFERQQVMPDKHSIRNSIDTFDRETASYDQEIDEDKIRRLDYVRDKFRRNMSNSGFKFYKRHDPKRQFKTRWAFWKNKRKSTTSKMESKLNGNQERNSSSRESLGRTDRYKNDRESRRKDDANKASPASPDGVISKTCHTKHREQESRVPGHSKSKSSQNEDVQQIALLDQFVPSQETCEVNIPVIPLEMKPYHSLSLTDGLRLPSSSQPGQIDNGIKNQNHSFYSICTSQGHNEIQEQNVRANIQNNDVRCLITTQSDSNSATRENYDVRAETPTMDECGDGSKNTIFLSDALQQFVEPNRYQVPFCFPIKQEHMSPNYLSTYHTMNNIDTQYTSDVSSSSEVKNQMINSVAANMKLEKTTKSSNQNAGDTTSSHPQSASPPPPPPPQKPTTTATKILKYPDYLLIPISGCEKSGRSIYDSFTHLPLSPYPVTSFDDIKDPRIRRCWEEKYKDLRDGSCTHYDPFLKIKSEPVDSDYFANFSCASASTSEAKSVQKFTNTCADDSNGGSENNNTEGEQKPEGLQIIQDDVEKTLEQLGEAIKMMQAQCRAEMESDDYDHTFEESPVLKESDSMEAISLISREVSNDPKDSITNSKTSGEQVDNCDLETSKTNEMSKEIDDFCPRNHGLSTYLPEYSSTTDCIRTARVLSQVFSKAETNSQVKKEATASEDCDNKVTENQQVLKTGVQKSEGTKRSSNMKPSSSSFSSSSSSTNRCPSNECREHSSNDTSNIEQSSVSSSRNRSHEERTPRADNSNSSRRRSSDKSSHSGHHEKSDSAKSVSSRESSRSSESRRRTEINIKQEPNSDRRENSASLDHRRGERKRSHSDESINDEKRYSNEDRDLHNKRRRSYRSDHSPSNRRQSFDKGRQLQTSKRIVSDERKHRDNYVSSHREMKNRSWSSRKNDNFNQNPFNINDSDIRTRSFMHHNNTYKQFSSQQASQVKEEVEELNPLYDRYYDVSNNYPKRPPLLGDYPSEFATISKQTQGSGGKNGDDNKSVESCLSKAMTSLLKKVIFKDNSKGSENSAEDKVADMVIELMKQQLQSDAPAMPHPQTPVNIPNMHIKEEANMNDFVDNYEYNPRRRANMPWRGAPRCGRGRSNGFNDRSLMNSQFHDRQQYDQFQDNFGGNDFDDCYNQNFMRGNPAFRRPNREYFMQNHPRNRYYNNYNQYNENMHFQGYDDNQY